MNAQTIIKTEAAPNFLQQDVRFSRVSWFPQVWRGAPADSGAAAAAAAVAAAVATLRRTAAFTKRATARSVPAAAAVPETCARR